MTLNRCGWCSALFSVGVAHCPQCGNCDYYEEGASVAKITRHGGPSYTTVTVPEEPAPAAEPVPVEAAPADVEPPSVYDVWLLADLREECEARGLAKSGNKADLVQRLLASDTVHPDEFADAASSGDEDEPAF